MLSRFLNLIASLAPNNLQKSRTEIKQHKVDKNPFTAGFNKDAETYDDFEIAAAPKVDLSQVRKEIAEKYTVPESPIKAKLYDLMVAESSAYGSKADDALYLVVKMRWQKREFSGDLKTYLSELINDVENAKRQYRETMYEDMTTGNVLSSLKFGIVTLMAES